MRVLKCPPSLYLPFRPRKMSSASPTFTGVAAAATSAVAGSARSRGFTIFLKFWTLGVILSSIAYGIAFTLFAASLYLLKKTSTGKRKKIHYALGAYITLMFTLSTISIVSGISTNLTAITTQTVPRNLSIGASPDAVVIVLANWASDGFLVSALERMSALQVLIHDAYSYGERPSFTKEYRR